MEAQEMAKRCTHVDAIEDVTPKTNGCEECPQRALQVGNVTALLTCRPDLEPGPKTTNVRGCAQLGLQLVSKFKSVDMGPRFRGDDDVDYLAHHARPCAGHPRLPM